MESDEKKPVPLPPMPYPPRRTPPRGFPTQKSPKGNTPPPSKGAIIGVSVVGAIFLALVIIAFTRSSGTSPAATDSGAPFQGTLIAGEGTQRRGADTSGFAAVTVPSEVSPRDLFLFGATSRNVVTLPEGASLRFSDSAQAGIDDLRKREQHYQVSLNLGSGKLWVVAPAAYSVTVTAKKASVTSQGDAVFEVAQTVDEKAYAVTAVRVFKGEVQISGQTKEGSSRVTVAANQSVRVNDDKMFPTESFDSASQDEWTAWNTQYVATEAPVPQATAATRRSGISLPVGGGSLPTGAGSLPAGAGSLPATTTGASAPAGAGAVRTTTGVVQAPPPRNQPPAPRPGIAPPAAQTQPMAQPAMQPPGPPPVMQPPPPPPNTSSSRLADPVYATGARTQPANASSQGNPGGPAAPQPPAARQPNPGGVGPGGGPGGGSNPGAGGSEPPPGGGAPVWGPNGTTMQPGTAPTVLPDQRPPGY